MFKVRYKPVTVHAVKYSTILWPALNFDICLSVQTIKQIKEIEEQLCSGSERKEMALNAIDVGSLENFLLPAPSSVAILGQLMAIASTIDFSLEKHVPKDGFKHVKQPGSFRACLVQICTSGCDAFTTADKNMDKIRLYCMQFQGHVKDLLRIILKGSQQEKSILAPIYLHDMMEKAKKCLELAEKTESDFKILTTLLSEVSIAAITAKGLHESRLAEAILQTKIIEKRNELAKRQKCEIEEEKREVIEQLSTARRALDEATDKIPGPIHTVGIAIFEKTVSTLSTSACLFGLASLSTPVAITAVAAKGVGEIIWKLYEKTSKKENKEDNKIALKLALKHAPEIYALIRSLQINIERRLCQETINDDKEKKDKSERQDHNQTKDHDDIKWIQERFRTIVKELEQSSFSCHRAVEATRHVCNGSISVCVRLHQPKIDTKTTEDLLNEVKMISNQAENLKIQSDQLFSPGSESCFHLIVESLKDNDGMVKEATKNVLIKMESRKQTLKLMKRKQEVVKQRAREINQQQSQLLEDLLKTDLQKINFEEIIKTLMIGMQSLGKLDEQWHMMVAFFAHITNRIEVCISQETKTFEKVLHGTGYKLTAGTHGIILETAAGINSIAYSVGLIAETYTDISVKHLVGATAGLIGMIALHPEKDADTLRKKRVELNNKCVEAQKEIRNLAAERRDMALKHINEQFERIKKLGLKLPEVEDVRKNDICESVAESIRCISNIEKDSIEDQ